MTLCVDLSNYSSALTPENLQALKNAGVGLVIVQAISPPPGYPAGKTREQIQACAAAGLSVDVYVWVWTHSDVAADMRAKLGLLDGLEHLIRKAWVDIEDVSDATPETRLDAARRALAAVDEWCIAHSKPRAGVYSGAWYFQSYLNNATEFTDRQLWTAQYDGIPNAAVFTPYGGWATLAVKQFAGSTELAGISGLDLNVLSVSEAADLEDGDDVTDTERAELVDTIAGLTNAIGYIAGDLLAPLTRKSAGQYVKAYVGQVRAVCDQFGINHA